MSEMCLLFSFGHLLKDLSVLRMSESLWEWQKQHSTVTERQQWLNTKQSIQNNLDFFSLYINKKKLPIINIGTSPVYLYLLMCTEM